MDSWIMDYCGDEMIAGTGPELLQPCIFYYSLLPMPSFFKYLTLPYLTLLYLIYLTLPYSKVLRSIP